MKYALVSLNLPLRTSSYTYSYDEEKFPDILFRRVSVSFGRRRMTGFVIKILDEKPDADFEIKGIDKVIDKDRVIDEELVDLAEKMSFLYKCSQGQALSLMVPNAKKEVEFSPFSTQTSFRRIEELSGDQRRVLDEYHDQRSKGRSMFYLFGVTGSGKSEVYLRLAEETIAAGRQVLYLVPEITLTEQLSKEVYERFSRRVAFIHSAMTPSQRLKAANGIRNGEIDLVIGARSASFAPFRSLGLIILDEEHESTYKSGNTPRYHARQIAQLRSEYNRCPLVMGSATPSFEAYHSMLTGRLYPLRMFGRIGKGAFPEIRVVDMLKEKGTVSPVLLKEMELELSKGNGVILFLNRRGYSHSIFCRTCGEPLRCPNCSVSLAYHKKRGRLVCHTCGYSEPVPSVCPSCRSRDLVAKGTGTELVEEEVRRLFPYRTVRRLDSDAAESSKSYTADTIRDFEEGRIDILLGTQMIAKGLNFPKVTLVGIINADGSLFSPDFRANERTFALLEQVAGRAGRFRPDGKVIIQTTQIANPAILAVENRGQEEFYGTELALRRNIGFPPYGRLVNLTLRGKKEDDVRTGTEDMARYLSELLASTDGVDVYDANACMVERRSTYYRYHVMIRADERSFAELLKRLDVFVAEYKVGHGLYLEIDVDPVDIS